VAFCAKHRSTGGRFERYPVGLATGGTGYLKALPLAPIGGGYGTRGRSAFLTTFRPAHITLVELALFELSKIKRRAALHTVDFEVRH
jgi:hypothetical protein